MSYYSGQGRVFVAERDSVTGKPGAFKFLGNVPSLNLGLAVEKLEHREATSGQRLVDATIQTSKQMTLSMALEDFTAANLSMAFYGNNAAVTGASVVDEVLPTTLATGDYVRLNHTKVSAVVVKDSAATPATLVAGTNYVVSSADHGSLQIVNPGAFVQPFKVSYTYGGYANVTMFQQASKERWLRFEGLNTADGNKPVLIELYKVVLDPISDFGALTDEIASFTLEAEALYDATKQADAALGGFGRIIIPT